MEGSVRGSGSVKHIKHGSNILNAHTALLRRIERRRQTTDLIIYFYAGRCTLEPPPFIHRGSVCVCVCVKWTQDLSLCKWFKWNRFFFLVVFLFFFGLLGGCWKGRRWFSIPNAHTYVRTRKRIPLYSYRLTCSLEPKFRAPTHTIGDKALVRRFGLKGVEEKQKISRSRAFSFNFLSSHRRQNKTKKKLTQRKLWTFRNGRFSLFLCVYVERIFPRCSDGWTHGVSGPRRRLGKSILELRDGWWWWWWCRGRLYIYKTRHMAQRPSLCERNVYIYIPTDRKRRKKEGGGGGDGWQWPDSLFVSCQQLYSRVWERAITNDQSKS